MHYNVNNIIIACHQKLLKKDPQGCILGLPMLASLYPVIVALNGFFPQKFTICQEDIVEQYTLPNSLRFILSYYHMKANSGQPSTPSGLFSARLRLGSVNSPFISPLRIVPSPYIAESNFFDQQANPDLNHFQLQQNVPEQKEKDEQMEEQEHQQPQESEIVMPNIVEEHQQPILIDQNNMLDFVLNNVNRNQKKLDQTRQDLEAYGNQFNKRLFDYLVSKFKKLRKTKEEMVKYCVRKSFKHITNKMRAVNKEAYINMENNEVVAQYFEKHCQGDLSISMPFKKNSEQKTMNSNFLKKIFKCRQYNIDYRQFLRNFPGEYISDNKKKIRSMNQSIKKCVKNKCLKSLDDYKRLPWTAQILQKIFEFAKQLMEHSPYRKQKLDLKVSNQLKQEGQKQDKVPQMQPSNYGLELETIKVPNKKSVIILTPPVRALQDPPDISDNQLLQ